MSIGFVVWNPFQVFHMAPIAAHLDDPMFVVVNRVGLDKLRDDFGGSISSFIDHPHEVVTPRQLTALDGKLAAFVCPNPIPGMNSLVSSRRVGLQYSMAKESYQYGSWRAHFDINLAYGDYTVSKLLRYGPAVAVGNPRFAPWFNGTVKQVEPAATSSRKTIVYLPTWGEFSSVPRFLSAVQALQDDYNVIVKLHHKIHLTEPDKAEQLASSGIENAFLPHDDLLPLLRQADLVVSDFSGAIFDAIYVRKPVVLLQDDPDSLIGPKFTYDSIEYARRDDIGPVVSSPDKLADAVAAMFDGSRDYREPNERLRAECFAEDVNAAERCAEVLEKVSRHRRNPRAPLSRKPQGKTPAPKPAEQQAHDSEKAPENSQTIPTPTGKAPRPGAKARLYRIALPVAKAVGPQTLVTVLSMPGPWATTRRKIARMSLRLSGHRDIALAVLTALHRRGQLEIKQRLWLADLLFTGGNGQKAAEVVETIADTDGIDAGQLESLVNIFRAVSGPSASYSTLTGLNSAPATPTATGTKLLDDRGEDRDVLMRVTQNAAVTAMNHTEFDLAVAALEDLLEVNDDLPELHFQYGRALSQAFRLDEARHAFAQALRLSPFNATYRRTYIGACTKAEQWEDVCDTSRTTGGDLALDISAEFHSGQRERSEFALLDGAFTDPSVVNAPSFSKTLDDAAQVASLRDPDYWISLHWRLIRAGAFSAAYAVKDIAARSVLDGTSAGGVNNPRGTVRHAQALVTLGENDEARELLSRLLTSAPAGDLAHFIASKTLADLDFLEGVLPTGVEWAASAPKRPFEQSPATSIARELFAGRRVAIVGPGRPPEGMAAGQIDSYDVVVRPNLFLNEASAHPTGSTQTDVAYFNSGFTQLGLDNLLQVASDQGVRQVVLRRPRSLATLAPRLRSGAVRFIDFEPSCHLFASSFGVQRMLYDIAHFGPKSVGVFNVDFFAGTVEYVEGYKVDNADVSFRGHTHDFRGDFLMSKNLRSTGAVEFDAVAASVLDLDVDEYLKLLDAKAAP